MAESVGGYGLNILVIAVIAALAVGTAIGYVFLAPKPLSTTGAVVAATATPQVIPPELQNKVQAYLNDNFFKPQGAEANITAITEQFGLYAVDLEIYEGGKLAGKNKVFVSKDAKNLIVVSNAFELDKKPEVAQPSVQPVPKTAKPDVKLFVMSRCPYGVAAEYAMIPVIKLLGDSANFDIRFIASETGNGTFDSLHGQPEVAEDMRQTCISANEPSKYLSYLECLVEQPAKAIQNGDGAAYSAFDWEATAKACVAKAGIDSAKLDACTSGSQGKDLLSKNIALANQLSIGSSPTIQINGADYASSRSSEAFKTAICNAFNTAPGSCNQTLSNATGTGNIACGA